MGKAACTCAAAREHLPGRLWKQPRPGLMLSATEGASQQRKKRRMGSKGLQVIAYIVLVAILAATGFGALGPAAVAF
jgi:hypothetical protein